MEVKNIFGGQVTSVCLPSGEHLAKVRPAAHQNLNNNTQ